MIPIPMTVQTDRVLVPMSINTQPVIGMTVGSQYVMTSVDIYDGDYTVIPSQTRQVLHTKELELLEEVVIEPIPNNYGLIGWNGATLTVS